MAGDAVRSLAWCGIVEAVCYLERYFKHAEIQSMLDYPDAISLAIFIGVPLLLTLYFSLVVCIVLDVKDLTEAMKR